MKAKGKLKKNIGRLGRLQIANKETTDVEPSDLSQLRKPIDTNLCSLRQVAQLFEKGSDEVQAILAYECDVVYECRICRSLFRSLANFISHKRVYCPEKYNATLNGSSMDPMNRIYNKAVFGHTEASIESEYKENCTNDRILRSQSTRKEPKKDLTSVVDMLKKKQNDDRRYEHYTSDGTCPLRISSDNEQVLLEIMDSNQAAYQTVLRPQMPVSSDTDLMKSQTLELKNMLCRNTAVLGPDGQLLDVNGVSTSDNPCGNEGDARMNLNPTRSVDLACSICNASFATKKTLTFHVKSKHMAHQMNYPCPCCTSIFTNRASVHRHLVKVHRKSNEQMRKLRSQIRATKTTNEDIATTKSNEVSNEREATEESQNLIIAQEWMENLELDTELQRCGACGKRFDRKAALVSHSQICPRRIAGARNETTTGRHKRASKNPPQRVTEIVEPVVTAALADDDTAVDAIAHRPSSPKIEIQNWQMSEQPPSISISRVSEERLETSIRVEDVSSLSKDVWDMIGTVEAAGNSEPVYENENSSGTRSREQSPRPPNRSGEKTLTETTTTRTSPVTGTSDVPEVIYTSIDNSRPVTLSVLSTEKKLGIQYRGIRLPTVTLEKINVPRDRIEPTSIEPNISFNVSANRSVQIDKKFSSLANLRKLQCLPCNRKFMSLINLRRHIAVHHKRNRYRCKLCDFKAFLKCDCIAHCNKKHNARNNRAVLAALVIEMPLNNDVTENERTARNNVTEARDELEVIDVTLASTSMEKTGNPSTTESEAPNDREGTKKNTSSRNKTVSTEATDVSVKEKPKRGRPPKARRTKKRRGKKKKVPRAKHVSPPTLAGEFSECDEITDIVNSKESLDKQCATKSGNLSRVGGLSGMDCDPELRKMVMEVIFGTTDKQNAEATDKENNDTAGEEIDIACERILDNGEIRQLSEVAVTVTAESETIDLIEKAEGIIEIGPVNDPNSNIHYGLQAVAFPKDVVFPRSPIAAETKSLTGCSLVQSQTHDARCDSKFPSGERLETSSSFSAGGRSIIYNDNGVNPKLTDTQQADIVLCAEK